MKNREHFLRKNGIRKNEEAFDFRKIRIGFRDREDLLLFIKPRRRFDFLE